MSPKPQFPIIAEPPALSIPSLKKSCIVFDLDGVLFDVGTPCRIDWDDVAGCTRLMENHRPNWPMISIANFFFNNGQANIAIVLCTGRPERYRKVTEASLDRYKVKRHDLWMREDDDIRTDAEVKKGMLVKIRRGLNVWFTVEDRDSVVEMWRNEGVLCLQNQKGDF